jgi:hypothetical protein
VGGIFEGEGAHGPRRVPEDVVVQSVRPGTSGIYIYGVVRAGGPRDFGRIGIGEGATLVQTIECGELAAVCSWSPLLVYETLAREKTVKDLVVHQLVIEKVMGSCTILPVKFGTMGASEEEVTSFLQEGSALLCEQLARMQDHIELDVVASWDLSRVLAEVYRRNRQLQEKQRELSARGESVRIEEKIALGKFVSQALTEQKETYRQHILRTLVQAGTQTCLHAVASDEMIINAAFLLEKRREEQFHELVRDLDRHLEDAVNFRVVGPLPPYSFATILLERLDSAKLEEARKLFGCHGELSRRQVRAAYHRLVQKYHPDSGVAADIGQFHRIQAAYRTLNHVLSGGCLHVSVYQWEKDEQ